MLSTGEVMGISPDFAMAYAKSQMASFNSLPEKGRVFISVKDDDKPRVMELARDLHEMGFKIVATKGTCLELIRHNIPSEFVLRISEGRPNIVDMLEAQEIDLLINTSIGRQSIRDSYSIRRTALERGVPYVTTKRAANAVVQAMKRLRAGGLDVLPIQEYYQRDNRRKK
jgi:carbamoyl-phosphate synthase large subunit